MEGNQAQQLHVNLACHVATLQINRPSNNHTTPELIAELSDAFERRRAVVIAAPGNHFYAGADLSSLPPSASVLRHAAQWPYPQSGGGSAIARASRLSRPSMVPRSAQVLGLQSPRTSALPGNRARVHRAGVYAAQALLCQVSARREGAAHAAFYRKVIVL